MELRHPLYYVERYGLGVAVGITYIVLGYLGLQLHPVHTFTALILPGAGIAIAVLFLYGYRLWPSIFIGALIVNLLIGTGFFVAVGIALGNTLGASVGAYLLRDFIGCKPSLLRLRDSVGIIAIAFIVATISSSIGSLSLFAGGHLTYLTAHETWRVWWIGDLLSILIITPMLLKWLSRSPFLRTRRQYVELWVAQLAVVLMSIFIFWTPQQHFVYYLFLPLAWVALRTGPRGMTLAIFVATSIAVGGTLTGYGIYAGEEFIYLQAFLGTIGILFPIITAIVEERKMVEELLTQHSDDLERALNKVSSEDEAKKTFLAVLAHELRNPLASILSSVELLHLSKEHDSETSRLLKTIDERVRAMTIMLDDVLDISRISENKLELQREAVSVDSLIDRSVHTAQTLIRKYGHRLSVIKPDDELYVRADPVRFEQILVNLLDNAAKYTAPRGRIELAAKRVDMSVVIRIRDSGIGIPRHMLAQVFEPFFQANRGKISMGGLGIGLPLTRRLIEMHGGTIEAQSEGEGRGSQFTVRIPLLLQPEEQVTEVSKPATKHRSALRRLKNTHSILLVDDNELAASSLGKLLELRGHDVGIVYNGADAVQYASQHHPEIIILDIGLPDIDGYEVARRVRTGGRYVPTIIALTGYGQPHDKEQAFEAGFQLHLTKPVGFKEIEAALKKVLDAPQK